MQGPRDFVNEESDLLHHITALLHVVNLQKRKKNGLNETSLSDGGKVPESEVTVRLHITAPPGAQESVYSKYPLDKWSIH